MRMTPIEPPLRAPSGAMAALFFALAGPATAAGTTSAAGATRPDEIVVYATRVAKPRAQVPAAVGLLDRDQIQLGRPQLGLDEALVQIPGLFMQDRYNFSQDLRISIRGFGARSAFGIRGIKILVDGIPETLPDGQGQVDSIEMGAVDRIEVIRGPSSSLYGNAAGGVINVYTERGPVEPFLEARLSGGEYGFSKNQVKLGGSSGDWNYFANVSDLELDGYREHSHTRSRQLNARVHYAIDPNSTLTIALNATDSPQADDPGGITREQADEDPRSAAANNLLFHAGEALQQQRLGLVYEKTFDEHHAISVRNYYVSRDFSNKLPTQGGGIVDLQRFFFGGGFSYTYTGTLAGHAERLIVGVDLDDQDDDRRRFDNLAGTQGNLSFDQNEHVTSGGVYVQNELSLRDDLQLTLGARHDRVVFDVGDDFLADGDDSGKRTLQQTSPMIGLSYALAPALDLYGNVSTSFETPTTTELANPAGGGFNPGLNPQLATNYEVGVKGAFGGRHWFEVALYSIDVKDELVPFELPSAPGRTFYQNAGRSNRDGLELGCTLNPSDTVRVALSYTYSDFTFDRFVDDSGNDYSGKRLPGTPKNQYYGELSYHHPSGFFGAIDALHVDRLYADNANTATSAAYAVSTLRAGYKWTHERWTLQPFAGVNNLFDRRYAANVRINAFGARYFEPAPARNVFAGLRANYSFR